MFLLYNIQLPFLCTVSHPHQQTCHVKMTTFCRQRMCWWPVMHLLSMHEITLLLSNNGVNSNWQIWLRTKHRYHKPSVLCMGNTQVDLRCTPQARTYSVEINTIKHIVFVKYTSSSTSSSTSMWLLGWSFFQEILGRQTHMLQASN